jgi:hypothetical protein
MSGISRVDFVKSLADNGGYVRIDEMPRELEQSIEADGVPRSRLEEIAGADRVIRGEAEFELLFRNLSAGSETASGRTYSMLRTVVDENRARAERAGGLRFAADAELDRVRRGETTLVEGASGDAVARVRQALMDMAYLEGSSAAAFDSGLSRALIRFQKDAGVEPSGNVDRETLSALITSAPPPGHVLERSPEYDRLYADGRLRITIAVRQSESGSHLDAERSVLRGLAERGYRPVRARDTEQLRAFDLDRDPPRWDPSACYFARRFFDEESSRDVTSLVRVLFPGVDQQRERASLRTALDEDEVIICAGRGKKSDAPTRSERPADGLRRSIHGREGDLNTHAHRRGYQLLILDASDPIAVTGPVVHTDVIQSMRTICGSMAGRSALRFVDGLSRREPNNAMLDTKEYKEEGFLGNSKNRFVPGAMGGES